MLILTWLALAACGTTPSSQEGLHQDAQPPLLPPARDDVPWRTLFDGTLNGWEKHGGGATFTVEDDCLVGTVGPGPNTFLCTKDLFGDFRLELELKLDVPGNSGIQIRSHRRPNNGRVFGYQCEVDPSDRSWSGGIYDEGRRGWLAPLDNDERARGAFDVAGWNHYVIEAIGPRIRSWVNGIPTADLIDPLDLDGFVALQVHSGKQGVIRWRNVRIQDFGTTTWRALWNGANLDGLDAVGGGTWAHADGVLRGTSSATETRHGHLISKQRVDDFLLRATWKAVTGNSGLYFRADRTDRGPGIRGFQAEIDPTRDSGGLYETAGRGWVVRPEAALIEKAWAADGWNTTVVWARGGDVRVWLNGEQTAALEDDPGAREGHIALQLHGGQDMDVRFRTLEWIPLHSEDVSDRESR